MALQIQKECAYPASPSTILWYRNNWVILDSSLDGIRRNFNLESRTKDPVLLWYNFFLLAKSERLKIWLKLSWSIQFLEILLIVLNWTESEYFRIHCGISQTSIRVCLRQWAPITFWHPSIFLVITYATLRRNFQFTIYISLTCIGKCCLENLVALTSEVNLFRGHGARQLINRYILSILPSPFDNKYCIFN